MSEVDELRRALDQARASNAELVQTLRQIQRAACCSILLGSGKLHAIVTDALQRAVRRADNNNPRETETDVDEG